VKPVRLTAPKTPLLGWLRWAAAIIGVMGVLPHALAATCAANVNGRATPSAQFSLNANATVTHSVTGLQWKRCNEGQSFDGTSCVGVASEITWPNALLAAKTSSHAGFTDWRLPNRQELESLLDETCVSPALNDTVFPNAVSDWTWTSTTSAASPAQAWVVDFASGATVVSDKPIATLTYARLVRSGQSFDPLAVPIAALPCNLDINGDGAVNHDTDGVLLLRYLMGFRGASLIANVPISVSRGGAVGVANFIGNAAQYDVFGRTVPASTGLLDGVVLARLMRTTPDTGLLQGVRVPSGAINATAFDVRAAVNARCGTGY
jgi:hypothetical protein